MWRGFFKIFGRIFGKRFFKHSHNYDNTIMWLCDVIEEKNSTNLSLYILHASFDSKKGQKFFGANFKFSFNLK